MALSDRLGDLDRRIEALELAVGERTSVELASVLEPAIALVSDTMGAYLEACGEKPVPPPDTDVLDVWKILVKGDPTWNAIRDNCRELVFYGNCLASGRADALPALPQRMAVRLARHVYLYVRTRCVRESRVTD